MENKKMKLWKKILILISIVILILILLTIRKFIIISNLENLSKDIENSKNYYVESYTLQGTGVNIRKSYNKDSKYLSIIQSFGIDISETRKLTIYEDENSQIAIIQSGETKIAFLDRETLGGKIGINTFSTDGAGFWTKLYFSLLSRITTDECNNKECYLIEIQPDWKIWVDKQTDLILREINCNIVTDYNYKLDVVRDEDIIKPDVSDCQIKDNN